MKVQNSLLVRKVFIKYYKINENILGWCKNNCSFRFVELCHLILEYILKCDYVIHHFNAHFLLFLLMTYYLFIFILEYRKD